MKLELKIDMNATETVSVRLDPKTRYLAELAARKHRRSLSNYIAWAIAPSLSECRLGAEDGITLDEESEYLWDVVEGGRFVKLAERHPELLNFEEQLQWKQFQDDHPSIVGVA